MVCLAFIFEICKHAHHVIKNIDVPLVQKGTRGIVALGMTSCPSLSFSFPASAAIPQVAPGHASFRFPVCLLTQGVCPLGVLVVESCLMLCDPWTVAHEAPLSMGFPRQGYWRGLPFPSPGDAPDPGIEPGSPTLQAGSLPSEPPGKPVEVPKRAFFSPNQPFQLYIVWEILRLWPEP